MWFLESQNIFYNKQYGFRKNRSTSDNINILESEIMDSFTQKEDLIAIVFDLEYAYNLRNHILSTLQSFGIQGRILYFIKNFLNNRTFKIILGNYRSESFILENGIPQGSVLSVILFLVHINCISQLKLATKVDILLYADDIVMFSRN